jgi:hypothetical protein
MTHGPASPAEPDTSGWHFLCGLFSLVAMVLTGYGLTLMFGEIAEADKIVGGDAYNYIILATRGAGVIGAGAASAALAVAFAILSRKPLAR